MQMSEDEKREYMMETLRLEEEKAEVRRYLIEEERQKSKAELEDRKVERMQAQAEARAELEQANSGKSQEKVEKYL